MTGYSVGPVLPAGEAPWPETWGQDPRLDDGHPHTWQSVLIPPTDRWLLHEVVRCGDCLAPRCGQARDDDPCRLRLGHAQANHIGVSGRTWAGPPTPRVPFTRTAEPSQEPAQ